MVYKTPMDELTAGELCERSGLTADELAMLESAGLLRPTRTNPEPLYRPKLGRWAQRLAYLLGEGWTLAEIKHWTRERWHTANPRAWPPEKPGDG